MGKCNSRKLPSFEYDKVSRKLISKTNINNHFSFEHYARILLSQLENPHVVNNELSSEKVSEPKPNQYEGVMFIGTKNDHQKGGLDYPWGKCDDREQSSKLRTNKGIVSVNTRSLKKELIGKYGDVKCKRYVLHFSDDMKNGIVLNHFMRKEARRCRCRCHNEIGVTRRDRCINKSPLMSKEKPIGKDEFVDEPRFDPRFDAAASLLLLKAQPQMH
jgi:hypothetical protein